jgi:hypothetical protein
VLGGQEVAGDLYLDGLGSLVAEVTVPSALMTGDSTEGPPNRACWAKALTPMSRALAIRVIFFMSINVV